MENELKSEKLTGAMLIKEFLRQRIVPLQDRPTPCGSFVVMTTKSACAKTPFLRRS